MRFCSRLSICFSTMQPSKKTGWGGYRLHRKSEHFVGTEPSLVKYHDIPDKKPTQPYGLQGTNHLLPGFGKIAAKLPTRTILLKDKVTQQLQILFKVRFRFTLGAIAVILVISRFVTEPTLPYTHQSGPKKLRPVRYIPDRDMEVWLCNCKHTKNRPFCDGSHKKFLDEEKRDVLADD